MLDEKPARPNAAPVSAPLPPQVTNHIGAPLEADMDFFVTPPPEIGELLSAYSSMRRGKPPRAKAARWGWILSAALSGIGLGVAVNLFFSVESRTWCIVWPLLLGLVGLAVGGFVMACTHWVSYVGTKGYAKYSCSGERSNVKLDRMLVFDKAAELYTAISNSLDEFGHYQNTNFEFRWFDIEGSIVSEIKGVHFFKEGNPPFWSDYWFGVAAESSWTQHLLEKADADLDKEGCIQFNLWGYNDVSVGKGFIHFHFDGRDAYCEIDDIESISVESGKFIIKRKNANIGWFSKEGVFAFPYAGMANVGLFFLALEKLLGFTFK